MPATTAQLRQTITDLVAERDLRFYDEENLYSVLGNETAGSRIRRLSNPLLDADGAKVLGDAIVTYLVPNADDRQLHHAAHVLRFCPKSL